MKLTKTEIAEYIGLGVCSVATVGSLVWMKKRMEACKPDMDDSDTNAEEPVDETEETTEEQDKTEE